MSNLIDVKPSLDPEPLRNLLDGGYPKDYCNSLNNPYRTTPSITKNECESIIDNKISKILKSQLKFNHIKYYISHIFGYLLLSTTIVCVLFMIYGAFQQPNTNNCKISMDMFNDYYKISQIDTRWYVSNKTLAVSRIPSKGLEDNWRSFANSLTMSNTMCENTISIKYVGVNDGK